MIANWKALGLASVALAAIAWLGLRGDTGPSADADVAAQVATHAATQVAAYERGCASHRSTRCTVEIRYAYPAADLSVVPEDVYF
jgi:hypothetical protein